MQIEKFLVIPEENVIYEVSLNDQVITELVKMFRTNDSTTANFDDMNNSFKISIVSANM
ncbi:6325_t:CDS:1, partial [Cetraspora pellucida]